MNDPYGIYQQSSFSQESVAVKQPNDEQQVPKSRQNVKLLLNVKNHTNQQLEVVFLRGLVASEYNSKIMLLLLKAPCNFYTSIYHQK